MRLHLPRHRCGTRIVRHEGLYSVLSPTLRLDMKRFELRTSYLQQTILPVIIAEYRIRVSRVIATVSNRHVDIPSVRILHE